MGKIFTIAEGLQNMGALRTGGQGSIYKGKRTGDIFVAVKLLPTPVYAENDDDKHFRDFKNEVEKLKKVNEKPNPNVVKILNSGITESGSLPFIEMEFIEGPDLAELLKPPHDPIFKLADLIKVAYQLANAVSHCHQVSVKHGDIKSNNVKYNAHTGNYVLLDFGLAIMSNEQRRDSLRHAGAVEFMAPEQNDGKMLPQTDVYSYGIVLYELLAGTVPFPLNNGGQTARNAVMLAHMDTAPPDAMSLRRKNMPFGWSEELKEREMHVPDWLLQLIEKCLQKDPQLRYADGVALQDAILMQASAAPPNKREDTVLLQNENEGLKELLNQERNKARLHVQQIAQLKETLSQRNQQLAELTSSSPAHAPTPKNISKVSVIALIVSLFFLGALSGKYLFPAKTAKIRAANNTRSLTPVKAAGVTGDKPIKQHRKDSAKKRPVHSKKMSKDSAKQKVAAVAPPKTVAITTDESSTKGEDIGKIFTLFNARAYFHTLPNATSVRKANISRADNARLKALDDQNGYIYIIFTNDRGQVSTGWLDKKDLIIIGE